jgi:hypothetical protein
LDLVHLSKLQDLAPSDVLLALLGKEGSAKLAARVPVATRRGTDDSSTPEQAAAIEAF